MPRRARAAAAAVAVAATAAALMRGGGVGGHVAAAAPPAVGAAKTASTVASFAPARARATATPVDEPWVAGIAAYGVDETVGNGRLDALTATRPAGLREVLVAIARDGEHTWRWRNYVVQHLSTLAIDADDAAACRAVVAATTDPEEEVRDTAVYSLARMGRFAPAGSAVAAAVAASLPAVLEAALADPGPAVQEAAVRSLALVPAPDGSSAATVERVALDAGRPLAVRVAAIDALAVLDAERARALAAALPVDAPRPPALARALQRVAAR